MKDELSDDMARQVARCKHAIARNVPLAKLREDYAARCIQISYGRDAENLDPYGAQNHEVQFHDR